MDESYDATVYVDLEDMISKKNLLEEKYNELLEMLKKYQKRIDETENIYNTPSSKYFRNISKEYMDTRITFLNDNFKVLCIDKLDAIIKKYQEYSSIVANQVGGSNREI